MVSASVVTSLIAELVPSGMVTGKRRKRVNGIVVKGNVDVTFPYGQRIFFQKECGVWRESVTTFGFAQVHIPLAFL